MVKNWIIFLLSVSVLWFFLGIEEPNVNKICLDKYTKAISNEQYVKCVSIVDVMQEISNAHEYEKDVYDCSNYSQDLKRALYYIDIDSEIIVGNYDKVENVAHAWIGIWVEPISGEFIDPFFDNYSRNSGKVRVNRNGKLEFFPER